MLRGVVMLYIPLGIMPKDIWELRRLEDIRAAIRRYTSVCMKIPDEWLDEYNELVKKVDSNAT